MKSAEASDGNPPGPKEGSIAEALHSWRYFFWLLGLVLVVVLFYKEEDWRGQWLWERYKHEMEARGERMDAAAYVPPKVPRDQNFAETPFLSPLFVSNRPRSPDFAAAYDAASPRRGTAAKGERANSWVGPRTDLRDWYTGFLNSTNRTAKRKVELTATNATLSEAAEGVLAGLADTGPVIDELREASKRPYARFGIHYDDENRAGILLPHLAVVKRVTLVLELRAAAELALGKTDAAFDDVQLMLYMANVCRDEPILVSQLVRMTQLQLVLHTIAEGMDHWSEPQLQKLEESLGHFDFCAEARRTLAAERSFFGVGMIDFVRRATGKSRAVMYSNMLSGNQPGALGPEAILMDAMPSGWFDLEALNYSRAFDDFLTSTIDAPQRRVNPAACRRAEERMAALTRKSGIALLLRHRVMSALLLPAISSAVRKAAFAQTGADAAALACALERCRRARGEFPESLNTLTPQFVEKMPHDVITGKPLEYRRGQDGQYVLYSVGWNEKDDGGIVGLNATEQTMQQTNGDWVWRPMAGDWR